MHMKRIFALVLVLTLLASGSALALDHKNTFDNEATFETMEEAHANGAAWLSEETGRAYVADPCMDDYPAGYLSGRHHLGIPFRRHLYASQCCPPHEHQLPGVYR